MTARLTATEVTRSASEAMHPLGRLGRPEDIASAIAWLLDPALRTLEVYRAESTGPTLVQSAGGGDSIRAAPFELDLALSPLWNE